MMRFTIPAVTGLAISAVAACSPGQSEFSCQGYPDGVSCISARNVYELTNSRSRVTQDIIEGRDVAGGPAVGDVLRPLPTSDPKTTLAPPVGADQPAAEPAEGVMRVWVGPHATAGGDVTAPNYVYSRVASKARDDGAIIRRFEPLKGRSEPARAQDDRPLEAGNVVVTARPHPTEDGSNASPSHPVAAWATNNVRVAEIYFESGQAAVSASGQNRLKIATSRLAELNPRAVLVAGFTDRVGSEEANQRLAKRRVDAVVKILKELGVTAEIIDAAQGEPEELNPAPDGTPDPNSRKVWVVALDVAPKPASAAAAAQTGKPASLTPETVKKAEVEVAPKTRRQSLRRDPDDHGDNDERDRGGKDHQPGMRH
ncbi:MAG: OmpA family protein [Alphaproteobacteria bacterium]